MQLSFTIPDASKDIFIDAWSQNYQANVPDPDNPGQFIPNPVTKAQHAKNEVKVMMVQRVKMHQQSLQPDIDIT